MCLRGRTNDTGTTEGDLDTAVGVALFCEGLLTVYRYSLLSSPKYDLRVRKLVSSHQLLWVVL